MMKRRALMLTLWMTMQVSAVGAHHSYSMFDNTQRRTVVGTVAKVEWANPHVFIWLYVRKASGMYDLYSFENGSVSMLTRLGWAKNTMPQGATFSVLYVPLRDGRNGGYLIQATDLDGKVLKADPGALGGDSVSLPQPVSTP